MKLSKDSAAGGAVVREALEKRNKKKAPHASVLVRLHQ
jgi:hypothetical protein